MRFSEGEAFRGILERLEEAKLGNGQTIIRAPIGGRLEKVPRQGAILQADDTVVMVTKRIQPGYCLLRVPAIHPMLIVRCFRDPGDLVEANDLLCVTINLS